MHLPWKKHRISQLVADLHSPANRRGSLVVQTGFPASLVDLFVKNRDRLRKTKTSHKKRCNRRGIDSSDVSLALSTPTPAAIPVMTRPNGDGSLANSVSVVVLKTFVVVAMAISTKKLVVGITLSAFVLLLLEFAGKHVDVDLSVFLKLCLDAKERLFGSIQWKKPLTRLENPKIAVCDLDSVVEIERVGADLVDFVAKEGNELLFCNSNSRRCRIQSNFIRRFVPKKLRCLKKSEGRDSILSTDHMHIDSEEHELECASNEYDHDEESETPWSCELSSVTSEAGRAREGDSGCLVMLVLIVLVGLFGGRIRALVLTLVWCLVLRFCWQRKGL